jgi:hypothetical protein
MWRAKGCGEQRDVEGRDVEEKEIGRLTPSNIYTNNLGDGHHLRSMSNEVS